MTWTIINFGLLLAAVIFFSRKPLARRFAGKHESMEKAVAEAEELRAAVEIMVTEYGAKLASLDADVEQILSEAREHGEREKQEILERAERQAQRIREDAGLSAERERERIHRELEKETLREAVRRAGELLRGRVTEREHRVFTQELISRLETARGR